LKYFEAIVKASKSDSFDQQKAILLMFGYLLGLLVPSLDHHVISLPLLHGLIHASILVLRVIEADIVDCIA
jgi:hypothetical protein